MMEKKLVVKSNKLIEARYNLNVNEQKIILYAVSQIDRNKEKINIVPIRIRDFCKLLGTTEERYTEIREIIRGLRYKEIAIETDTNDIIAGWISSMDYKKDEGIIEIEFSEKLIPHLINLKKRFTRYQIGYILNLKNKYSIRIYELLKQYEKIGKRDFELKKLKRILSIENKYKRIYDLKTNVINEAIEEINLYTDIQIDYDDIKKGRRIAGFTFTIESKSMDEINYINFLNDHYNIKEIQNKMGLGKENFNSKQIMDIYELAVQKTQDVISPFEYVRLNYNHMIDRGTARNNYNYLLSALEDDHASAAGQLSLLEH